MITSIVEFFRNLPAKKCVVCGKEMEEQHECYENKCNHCLGVKKVVS